jgi:Ala-tRNA(Pro) deacylase
MTEFNPETSRARSEKVYALFQQLGISYETVTHPPLFTEADNEIYKIERGAEIFKNLFLRNKNKSRYYLLSLPLTKRADLTALQKILGETRLSFGDESVLEEKLHIKHGSVSILNFIDAPDSEVTLLLDSEILDYPKIGVHPNDNTQTIIFSPEALSSILTHCNINYRFIKF